MCGIFGFWRPEDEDLSELLLDRANNLLSHRGPDGAGKFFDKDNSLGFSHTRLAILDLTENGKQPFTNNDSTVVLTYNGEIYNYVEKRNFLLDKGYSFTGTSDTEVLFNLYLYSKEYNIDFKTLLPELNGIFSFAIYDKYLNKIFLARDAYGVKPLYYKHDADGIVFSSELKVINNLFNNQITFDKNNILNKHALDNYLTYLYCPGEKTIHNNINKLSPGGYIEFYKDQTFSKGLWFIPPVIKNIRSIKSNKMQSDNEYLSITKNLIRKSVHRQMTSDVEVGAFLSGGVDSSLVVAFAKEINPNIKCFTIDLVGGNDLGIVNDLPYAINVAKHLNVSLEIVKVDLKMFIEKFSWMIYQLDEPIADIAALNVFFISRLARENGIKVLLSGVGGDDVFTGYRRHTALKTLKLLSFLPKKIRSSMLYCLELLPQNLQLSRRIVKLLKSINNNINYSIVELFKWNSRRDLLKLYSKDFLEQIGQDINLNEMLEYLDLNFDASNDSLNKILSLEQRYFLADHNLLYSDKMSMAAGVELRVPFLDLELVEYASCLPNNILQKGVNNKWVLKKILEDFLPNNLIYRSKSGFGAPVRKWIKSDLQNISNDLLSKSIIESRGFFSYDRISKLIKDNNLNKIDASYLLLSIISIELWCRKFLDEKLDF